MKWQGYGKGCHRSFELLDGGVPLGVSVQHCGHPTALRPWYSNVIPGTAFQYAADAKDYALSAQLGLDWPSQDQTRGVVARNTASPIPNREPGQ